MIRAILRYTQNTLVLSSALLVMLALQRMQSFDFHHDRLNDHPSHHQEEGAVVEAFDVGPDHNHVFFGREFTIGLFRFVLPRLESEMLPPLRNKARQRSSRGSGSEEVQLNQVVSQEGDTSTAYVIEITDCSGRHVLDSAAVLQRSICLSTTSDSYELVAFLPRNSTSMCGPALRSMGYQVFDRQQVVVPKSLQQFASDTCLSDRLAFELYVMQLEVTLAVKIPLPSLVYSTEESGSVYNRAIRFGDHHVTDALRKTSSHVLVPSEKALESFISDVQQYCSVATSNNDRPNASWTFCGTACDLMKHAKIVDFSNCPMPWECSELDGTTSPHCRAMIDRWFQLRHDMEQERMQSNLETDTPSAEKPKEVSAQDLARIYCKKSGPEYLPMLQALEPGK